MNGWITIWTCVLTGALFLFACLTVVVTIGGLRDIRRMFRQIVHQHEVKNPTHADPDES